MSRYTIQSGDTFFAVAKKLGISLDALQGANPGVSPSALQVGQVLKLPGGSTGSSTGSSTYTIQSGDTFWKIAQQLGTSVDALQAANPGVNAGALQVGKVINVPGGGSTGGSAGASTGGSTGGSTYTIQSGDSFWKIAQQLGISVNALEAANPGVNASALHVGQVINVQGGSTGSTANGSGAGSSNGTGGGYVQYGGPASNFPDPSQWAQYDALWAQNSRLMKFNDSDSEIDLIKSAIETVSRESGLDVRAILCVVMQECGGNVRVPTTNNGVRNPGIMQSHNGVEFNPADPAGSILQMVRDGTVGTVHGAGLKQLLEQYGNYYSAFRAYNSGSVNQNDLNDPVGATAGYVRDTANRLMGHSWSGM